MSKKYELNWEDIKRLIRATLIMYAPVCLLFLNQIQNNTFDYKILWALIISTTIDIFRRLLQDNTK